MWLIEKDGLIPMSFVETLHAVSVPSETRKAIDRLLRAKRSISELGKGRRSAEIDSFVKVSMKKARAYCQNAPVSRVPSEIADELFRTILKEIWP